MVSWKLFLQFSQKLLNKSNLRSSEYYQRNLSKTVPLTPPPILCLAQNWLPRPHPEFQNTNINLLTNPPALLWQFTLWIATQQFLLSEIYLEKTNITGNIALMTSKLCTSCRKIEPTPVRFRSHVCQVSDDLRYFSVNLITREIYRQPKTEYKVKDSRPLILRYQICFNNPYWFILLIYKFIYCLIKFVKLPDTKG